MITEKDLQEAIAECEGQRHPTANTCIKLAAFYTIKQHMYPDTTETDTVNGYSFAPAPDTYSTYESDSDFWQAAQRLPDRLVWSIMDDLMSALSVLNPKLYNSIMQKIRTAE